MSDSGQKKSRGVLYAAIAIVIVLLVLGTGFLVPAKSETRIVGVNYLTTQTVYVPSTSEVVTTVTSTSYSTEYSTFAVASTETEGVFAMQPQTLNPQCNNAAYAVTSAHLPVGSNVQITFSASATINGFVLNSANFAIWQKSQQTGLPNPPGAVFSGEASGTITFPISASDTYYLVLLNQHNGLLCVGSSTVGILSVSGSSVFVTQSETTVTLTNSQEIVQPETITVTSTSTETNTITTSSLTTTTTTVGLFDP